MKTFSKYLAKITLLVIVVSFLYLPGSIKIVHAAADDQAICGWVNAQNGSAGNETLKFQPPPKEGTTETSDAKNKRETDNKTLLALIQSYKANEIADKKYQAYQNQIVVITEEPLGTPSSGFSTTCARLTTCATGSYDPNNPNEIRKCFTKYTSTEECKNYTPPDQKTLADPKAPYSYCEIVQVYSAAGGTSLLYGYIGQVYRYIAVLGGFIAVFTLIFAGVMRSAAGDNPDLMGKANQLVTRCITGLIVLFLSAVILYTINPNFFVF